MPWHKNLTGSDTATHVFALDLKSEDTPTFDGKPGYWRSNFLWDNYGIKYKHGRPPTPPVYAELKNILNNDPRIISIGVESAEADDVAGAIVRLIPTVNVVLHTVDSDWMGLINDRCAWVCAHGWSPRVRFSKESVAAYCEKKKWRKSVRGAKDIWPYKAELGDKSDNLPKGSPIGVIDLLDPSDMPFELKDRIDNEVMNKLGSLPVSPYPTGLDISVSKAFNVSRSLRTHVKNIKLDDIDKVMI